MLELMSTLKVRDGEPKMPRVLSGFIRQMSEDNMLIPEESINLISIVGQGQAVFEVRIFMHMMLIFSCI